MIQMQRIVCPIDFSEGASHAVAMAASLAHWYGARLDVLYVHATWPLADMLPSVRSPDARPVPLEDPQRQAMLDAMRQFVAAAGVRDTTPVQYHLVEGLEVVSGVLTLAAEADAVVIGSHGRSGFQRLLLGSVAERVLRKATCPVLVVPARSERLTSDASLGRRILCPVDFSDESLAALEYAVSLAEESDAALTLLHVIEVPPELREAPIHDAVDVDRVRAAAEAEALRRLRALIPEGVRELCTVRTRVAEGRAAREILRAAVDDGDDLIVLGVRGRNAVDLLVFGSNTQYVVRGATCPVLVVHGRRPAAPVSPGV